MKSKQAATLLPPPLPPPLPPSLAPPLTATSTPQPPRDRDPSSAPHHIRKPPRGTLLPLTAGPVHGKDLSVDTLTAQAALRLQKT